MLIVGKPNTSVARPSKTAKKREAFKLHGRSAARLSGPKQRRSRQNSPAADWRICSSAIRRGRRNQTC
jgi:hypothetical protein